jgi:DNA-binding NarL/FixJ family response regulator
LALVEDEMLVRQGLQSLLDGVADIECTIAAGDHLSAVRQAEFQPPDVALVDQSASHLPGAPGIRLWLDRLPQVRLILFDETIRLANLRSALQLGLAGYVTKCDSFDEVLAAIRNAARGADGFTPGVQARLRATPRGWELDAAAGDSSLLSLTPREIEVLVFLAQGLSGKQCSEQLGISPSTVDNHKQRIMRKLNVRKAVELTRLALREGLISH